MRTNSPDMHRVDRPTKQSSGLRQCQLKSNSQISEGKLARQVYPKPRALNMAGVAHFETGDNLRVITDNTSKRERLEAIALVRLMTGGTKENIEDQQRKSKDRYDQGAPTIQFDVGDRRMIQKKVKRVKNQLKVRKLKPEISKTDKAVKKLSEVNFRPENKREGKDAVINANRGTILTKLKSREDMKKGSIPTVEAKHENKDTVCHRSHRIIFLKSGR